MPCLWILTIFGVKPYYHSSCCKTAENEEVFFSLLSPHSQTDCCGWRQKRATVDKILLAGRVCYQGTAFQSLSVCGCHKNWPQYFPFVKPRLPISLAPCLRIKLCHVLHSHHQRCKLCLFFSSCKLCQLVYCVCRHSAGCFIKAFF